MERATYRLVGQHNGPTVVSLELAIGIRENATSTLLHSVVQGLYPLHEPRLSVERGVIAD